MRIPMRSMAAVVAGAMAALLAVASPAAADEPTPPAGCSDGKPWYRVSQVGPATYQSIGDPAGKYNSSAKDAELTFTMEVTTTRKTTWEVSAGGSIGWGIATVEAKTSYNVAKESISKRTVSDKMWVPSKRHGMIAPKVQYRTFAIDQMRTVSPCKDVFIKRMGKLKAITGNPYFSSCIGVSECTPRP